MFKHEYICEQGHKTVVSLDSTQQPKLFIMCEICGNPAYKQINVPGVIYKADGFTKKGDR